MAKTLDTSPDASLRRIGVTLETVVRRIVRTFDEATPHMIEQGSTWYDEAGQIATDLAAESEWTREQCAAVIAHLSPRTPWARNVMGATDLCLSGEKSVGIIGRNYEAALASLEFDDPVDSFGGPKTRRFYLNILGDREAVTVDVWACRVAGIDETLLGRVGVYDAVEHAYRLAARRRGVDPSTMQATTWIVARNGRHA